MKVWEKPQLVVLTRSKPEEAVLGYCKEAGVGVGPGVGYLAISCLFASSYVCEDCSAYTIS